MTIKTILLSAIALIPVYGMSPSGKCMDIFPAAQTQGAVTSSYLGANGSEFKSDNGLLQLRRISPGQGEVIKGRISFRQPLSEDLAVPGSALCMKIRCVGKSEQINKRLTVSWHAIDKTQSSPNSRIFFTHSNDWQELIVPLPKNALPAEALTLVLDDGNYDFNEIILAKPRRIEIELTSDPLRALDSFTVKGRTDIVGETVWICIDANGKVNSRKVVPLDGQFVLTWENPQLTPGKNHRLYAKLGDGKAPASVSLPVNLFGYRRDYSYAWLKVKGKQIVTSSDEQPFIPVGIGYGRDVIIPAQDEEVMKFCKSHHLNTVRLAFYTRRFNGDAKKPINIDEHIKNHLEPVVAAAKRNGMYVILDDHEYFHQRIDEANARGKQESKIWEPEVVENWIACWTKIATVYRDEPHVLGYELQNEPNDMSPEMVRDFYTRCIKAIRKVDQKHIILVGTNNWSHARALDITWAPVAATLDAPYNNVVFAFHDYPEDNHPWIVQKHVVEFRDKYNVPVMCTEFGATHWQHGETVCREFQAGMLALFAKENIGWMIWALKRLEDNPRNPYNEVDKTGMGPPKKFDSCPYSDLWPPVAKIMGTPFPEPK